MRTRLAAAAVAFALLTGAAACSQGPPEEASRAARAFAAAWSSGTLGATVDPRTAKAAGRDLTADARAVRVRKTTVRPAGELTCLDSDQAAKLKADGKVCRQPLTVTHELAGLGDWHYTTTAQVRQDDQGRWKVWWTPQTFHPKLVAGTELLRHRELPKRASILDRAGKPLTKETPVVRVGVEPRRVEPDVTYAKLQQVLDVDPNALRRRAEAADPTFFVDVLTLREPAYQKARARLDDIPGVVTREDTMSLGPSSSFARGVLGVVAPATADSLKDAGPFATDGDAVGASGLQAAYQTRLAGSPSGRIDVVRTADDHRVATVFSRTAKPGRSLRTTLDQDAQNAAEDAVAGQQKPTALVAVRAGTGEVLAAANGPGVTSYNRAFVGHYAPGSTFKVVSVSALLEGGLRPGDTVTCPADTSVGGKHFKNAYSFSLPDGPMTDAFAHSCNTTVVDRARDLDDGDLVAMAERFGIGTKWKLGLPAYSGSVPEPHDLVDRAASMIGQGRVLMSPLGMALVAATVDAGRPYKPVLLPDVAPGGPAGEALPAGLVQEMRGLMRAVVADGSAKQLDLPGPDVHAKTGTAEYGSDDPPRTHAWMIGYRGDIAFAVLVEDGGAGGKDAGPVARTFLRGINFVE
ncbi:Cell division protein FtsI/penicillin-binding protein 2 [Actinopolymorpha cephalotaxi]|uniref:Cell division protein FtsI/penicillin-binding protein 2 n=1 Tax=Actinopolymorpha cephalotaxi TaxID=504797 RepID=A0A1I2MCI5_9ACTN|nr:penicillin-binding transpeptidase domain-containing protein [Actinopolymorpha cephalotaxi]NYH81663.1 cell division protein FtsI/penicillin-binding protein 2 [Actinopolymorpha cephalotaxi]SFF88509.1 Cell division protein FtsI/penicillin-binding protein 2 [Actinopolymorpha cephalotaxi]